MRRALRRSQAPCRATIALVEEATAIAGCSRIPRVVVLPGFPSPAVSGTLRPELIIPREFESLDADALLPILVHELFHVRRRDLLLMPVVALAQAAWWPHTFVRAASRSFRATIEETRDQDTIEAIARRESDESARSTYARVLVDLADPATRPVSTPASARRDLTPLARSLPFTRSRRELERRITMIFESTPPRPVATFAGIGLVCALGAASFVDRVITESTPTADRSSPPSPQESHIEVERAASLPDWYSEIDARLDRRYESVEIERSSPLEAIELVARAIDCQIRVPAKFVLTSRRSRIFAFR